MDQIKSAEEEIKGIDFLTSDDDYIYGWTQMDNGVIYCKEITDSEFRTYAVVRSLVNQFKKVAWPSVETIAGLSGHSARTTQRNITRLVELDLIQRIPRSGSSNNYMVKKHQNSKVLRNEQDILEWRRRNQPEQDESPADPPKPPSDPTGKSDKDADDKIPITDVIKYLNEKAGKKINSAIESNRKDIRSRWKECRKDGMSEEEIKRIFVRIIDLKVAQFSGKIFEDRKNPGKPGKPGEFFLKPINLFNQKNFVKYCDEIDLIDQGKMGDGQASAQPSAPAPTSGSGNTQYNRNKAVLEGIKQKIARGEM